MQMTRTRATLVDASDVAADSAALIATLSRAEVEAAAASADPPELLLEVQRAGDGGVEHHEVRVEWERSELERLLSEGSGREIRLLFNGDELDQAVAGPEIEAHGLRERALVLTVAAATAATASANVSNALAAPDPGGGSSATTAAVHDEAGLSTRGITQTPAHDEAGLAARGIDAQATAAVHDEAGLASRGITGPGTRDEATLASRGIESPSLPAVHDEATLVARGIGDQAVAVHDEASLAARGIESPPATDGGPSGFELPTVDATSVAVGAGLVGGFALLITAAGFAARRDRITPA